MNIREETENIEKNNLSKYAVLSINSKGRDIPEEECDIRTIFQRDRDRILHSKSFRRLKRKTQVFMIPEGDHYRTRLTHTLEVSQIARTIAKSLRLNEDLTEAIALGHDLGHTPFGHAGEDALNEVHKGGFEHCFQSLRIVEKIEKNGKGLNLSYEVRDGIVNHRTSGNPNTLEGKIVRISDKIAYINHDVDDAILANIMKEEDIPIYIREILGMNVHDRIDTLIKDIINTSYDKGDILQSNDISKAMGDLRSFLFKNIYKGNKIKNESESKAKELLKILYTYYLKNIEKLPKEYIDLLKQGETKEQIVCDYVSGMTDDYAIYKFNDIFVPQGFKFN